MSVGIDLPAELATSRLRLIPIREADAEEMAVALGDPQLHEFIGGQPLGPAELRLLYRHWVAGSADPRELWLNWVVRLADTGEAVGTMQATVTRRPGGGPGGQTGGGTGGGLVAEIAWVIGIAWQGRGLAAEAAVALVTALTGAGVAEITACIHPRHRASERVAERAGLLLTARMSDGERVWQLPAGGPRPPA